MNERAPDNGIGGAPEAEAARVSDHLKAAAGEAGRVRDHLKAASSAAGEQLRAAGQQAAGAMRGRAHQVEGWARSRMGDVQSRVEADPRTAALWALGLGVAVGVLLGALLRTSRGQWPRGE
jgi:hypothetical protein